MVNVNKLRGRMVELGVTVRLLAQRMGVNYSSLYRRLKEPESFTIGEATKIKSILELSSEQATDIFFAS